MQEDRLAGENTQEHNKRRVLVVDDELPVLDAMRAYLTAHGFAVDTASEREEAEALLTVVDYAILIADLRLTGVHGREGLELVRVARRQCPLARIIVVTAFGSPEIDREARRCGADAVFEKPVPLSHLTAKAFELLGEEWGGVMREDP